MLNGKTFVVLHYQKIERNLNFCVRSTPSRGGGWGVGVEKGGGRERGTAYDVSRDSKDARKGGSRISEYARVICMVLPLP